MGLFHPWRDAGEGEVEWLVLLNLCAVRVAAPGECRSIEKCASPLKGSAHAQLPAKDFCSALIYTILWGQEKWLSWLQGLLATGGKGGLCKNNLFSWLGTEIPLPLPRALCPDPQSPALHRLPLSPHGVRDNLGTLLPWPRAARGTLRISPRAGRAASSSLNPLQRAQG